MDEAFVKEVRLLEPEGDEQRTGHPWDLPAIGALAGRLALDRKVTYLIGENGSGKSTLLEAIAVAAGLNPEGGSSNFSFSTRDSHSELWRSIRLVRGVRRPRTDFFLRAEACSPPPHTWRSCQTTRCGHTEAARCTSSPTASLS